MLQLLYGHDEPVAIWTGNQLGRVIHPPYVAIGIVEPGETRLRGGIVLNDYTGPNIEVTLYAPGCLHRHLIKELYGYVFDELKCLRLTARTQRSNKRVCKLMRRLGFDYEATLKQYFGPKRADDAIVFRLTHDFASTWM